MDTTLKSGKKLVQLVHQSDTNVPTKVLEVPNLSGKCTNSTDVPKSTVAVGNTNQVVDEATQVDIIGEENLTVNVTDSLDSTRDTNRYQVTDLYGSMNHLPANVHQIEATQNNETQVVTRQPLVIDNPDTTQSIRTHLVASQHGVNKQTNVSVTYKPDGKNLTTPPWIKQTHVINRTDQPLVADNPVTTQSSTHLVATQHGINEQANVLVANKPDGKNMTVPPWIIQTHDINRTDQILNIVPIQNTPTNCLQNDSLITSTPLKLKIQINQPNGDQQYYLADQHNPIRVRNLLNLQNQNVGQNILCQIQNAGQNNLGLNQNAGQSNLSQNQNVGQDNLGQNQIVNNNQMHRTAVLELNPLKRKVPNPNIPEQPHSLKVRRSDSKDYDPNWFKKAFGNLDKRDENVKEGRINDNNALLGERDISMPIIQNVTSLANNNANHSIVNNNKVVIPKLRNIAPKPIGPIANQDVVAHSSGEDVQNSDLADGVIQHTSTVASHQTAETEETNTVQDQKINETQRTSTDATATARVKPAVIKIDAEFLRRPELDNRIRSAAHAAYTEAGRMPAGNIFFHIQGFLKLYIFYRGTKN